MILLDNVTKKYKVRGGTRTVLNSVNFKLNKGEHIGILGRNGTGKSTLTRLIGGVELPTSGRVVREMKVSWPLAFGGGFQGSLTGMDNVKFLCRVYGVQVESIRDYVEDFSELGRYMREPLKSYSSGMRARLAFAMSMAIDFDCYLIDEVTAVGDARFKEKCQIELFEKRKDRAWILISHSANLVKKYCENACVLEDGVINTFDNMDLAYDFYNQSQLHK